MGKAPCKFNDTSLLDCFFSMHLIEYQVLKKGGHAIWSFTIQKLESSNKKCMEHMKEWWKVPLHIIGARYQFS